MKGFIENIEELTLKNDNFRKVLYTSKHSQLVLMNLLPGQDIGEEVHDVDQFLRFEVGQGKAFLNDVEYPVIDGTAVVVPVGVKHNIVNTGTTNMKLYTVYSPAHHRRDTVHVTKEQAELDEEHFDGVLSE